MTESCKFCEKSIDRKQQAVIVLPCGCSYHLLCRSDSNLRRQCYEHQNPQDALVNLHDSSELRVNLQNGAFVLDSDRENMRWNDALEVLSKDLQQFATFDSIQFVPNKPKSDEKTDTYPVASFAQWWCALDYGTRARIELRCAEGLKDVISDTSTAVELCSHQPGINVKKLVSQDIRLRHLVEAGYDMNDLTVLKCTWPDLLALKPTVDGVKSLGTANVISLLRNDRYASLTTSMALFNTHFFEGLCRRSLPFLLELRLTATELQSLNVTVDNLRLINGFDLVRHLPAFQVDMKTWNIQLGLSKAHLLTGGISQYTIQNRWKWVSDQSHVTAFEKIYDIAWTSLQKMTAVEEQRQLEHSFDKDVTYEIL